MRGPKSFNTPLAEVTSLLMLKFQFSVLNNSTSLLLSLQYESSFAAFFCAEQGIRWTGLRAPRITSDE